uniref:Cadherin domain-containing protein n=1 Tax=Macrostomum lignano TaxID=282301 RepID=A0A1I8I8Q1_9PLAT
LGSGSNSAELRFTTSELAMPTVTGLRRDGNSATTLLLDAWPAGYCLRVEAAASVKKSQTQQQQQQQKLDASERQWRQVKLQQSACDAPSDGRLTGLDLSTLTYRLSLCLADRLAVCGPAATTENMSGFPEVSSLTIIIVAAFCTLLIICLVAILVFFCCRNRPLASKEAASSGDAATSAARASELDSPPARRDSRLRRHPEPDLMASTYKSFSSGKPYAMVSPHPSLTSTDETSIDQTNKVFSTLLSANHPIVGNNNLESGSDNSGTFLHPGRQRKFYSMVDLNQNSIGRMYEAVATSVELYNAAPADSDVAQTPVVIEDARGGKSLGWRHAGVPGWQDSSLGVLAAQGVRLQRLRLRVGTVAGRGAGTGKA